MVRLLSLSLLLILLGCRKEVDITHKLTPAELQVLRDRASQRCATDAEVGYTNFLDTSTEAIQSANFQADKGFKVEIKVGAASIRTIDYQVFKQDIASEIIYFYVSDTTLGSGAIRYFLKYERSDNDQIITDLQTNHCDRTIYKNSSISENGPLTVQAFKSSPNGVLTDEITDDYSFSFGELALVSSYRMNRSKITRDAAGNQSGTTESTTTTVTYPNFTAFGTTNAGDTTKFNQLYCDFPPTSPNVLVGGIIGFPVAALSCPVTPTGWGI